MKHPLLIIAFLSLLSFADHHVAMAQSPEGFTYQAVVRDGSGDLVTSATVGMRISILDAIGPDNAVYVETHSASTNANGLVSLTVGSGTSGDDFSAIDWGSGTHYIKTETDPAGGSNYTVSGTQQLMSVPYALYAATSGTAEFLAGASAGDMVFYDGSTWVAIPLGLPGQILQLSAAGVPTWSGGALSTLTTTSASAIAVSTAATGGIITNDGNGTITARGVCYSTSPAPTLADDFTTDGSGTGAFVSNLTGLTGNTTYYVRAYATNSAGTAYGNEQSFTTLSAAPGVTSPTTGRVWMDRNLGATQVATSISDALARGSYYQWGRGTDGHEQVGSAITSTRSATDTPGHGNFITHAANPNDWRLTNNDNLWQGVHGINNPCPEGYRIPTKAEWDAEIAGFVADATGGFDSFLKLPNTGYRNAYSTGDLDGTLNPYYWTSTTAGSAVYWVNLQPGMEPGDPEPWGSTTWSYRATGICVRCIQD